MRRDAYEPCAAQSLKAAVISDGPSNQLADKVAFRRYNGAPEGSRRGGTARPRTRVPHVAIIAGPSRRIPRTVSCTTVPGRPGYRATIRKSFPVDVGAGGAAGRPWSLPQVPFASIWLWTSHFAPLPDSEFHKGAVINLRCAGPRCRDQRGQGRRSPPKPCQLGRPDAQQPGGRATCESLGDVPSLPGWRAFNDQVAFSIAEAAIPVERFRPGGFAPWAMATVRVPVHAATEEGTCRW